LGKGAIHQNADSCNKALPSGDEVLKYGVWIKGFVGFSNDKDNIGTGDTTNETSSKINLRGAIIGADTKIQEDLTIGIAYSNIQSKSKHKVQYLSKNSNILANIFTLYGSSNINCGIMLNGNFSYGNAVIKTADQIEISKSFKQKVDLLSSSLIANYLLYSSKSLTVTPKLGTCYNNTELKGYETDSIRILKFRNQQLQLNTGITISTIFNNLDNLTFVPELSLDYAYNVLHKGNKVQINNLSNQPILTQDINQNKSLFKLGIALNVIASNLDVGGGYEQNIQGKNKSYLGYIKLRVNF